MKNIKKIPTLRFPEFSEEWEYKQLDDFLSFKNGINADKDQYGNKGVKFINVLDIINNYFITNEKIIGCVDIDDSIFLKNKVDYGDILFQRSSETREEVGQANVYLDKNCSATFGGFVIRGKKIAEYHPIFMNYLLKTDFVRKEITNRSGGSTRYNVGQEILKVVNIYIPSLNEQEKIADFIFQIDNRIEKITKKKELLEKYKKGVMQKIFNQEIRFKNDNDEDYSDWEEKKLGDVIKLQGGYAFKSEFFKNEGVPIIRISNISNEDNYIDLKNIIYYDEIQNAENFTIKNGDLLLAMSGATTGKSSIYNLSFDAYLNQRVGLFKLKESNFYYPFLIQFVFSIFFKKQLDSVLVAGAQPNISSSSIENFDFNVPCLEEQQKIANFLTEIDKKINLTEKQLNGTKQYKKGLLQQMFI